MNHQSGTFYLLVFENPLFIPKINWLFRVECGWRHLGLLR